MQRMQKSHLRTPQAGLCVSSRNIKILVEHAKQSDIRETVITQSVKYFFNFKNFKFFSQHKFFVGPTIVWLLQQNYSLKKQNLVVNNFFKTKFD